MSDRGRRFWNRIGGILALGVYLVFILGQNCAANGDLFPPHTYYTLPSAKPVGNVTIDTIHFEWLPAQSTALAVNNLTPTVIIVPGLGDTDNSPQDQIAASYFTHHGINCAIIMLPYTGHRLIDGKDAQDYYLSEHASVVTQALLQSASDIETVREWVGTRPSVDATRIGVLGWSEGAIIVHLAMGLYSDLHVGVAIGGGGDLADIRRRTILLLPIRLFHPYDTTPNQLNILSQADPLTYAGNNQPRHVLMIQGSLDNVIPPHDSIELWNALGKPPIEWTDMGHIGLGWTEWPELDSAYAYYIQNWAPPGTSDPPIPAMHGPLFKLGLITMATSHPLLCVQDQLFGIGQKDNHTPVVSFNIGATTSRPFAAIGYTANSYMDVGVAMRVSDHFPTGYVSVYYPF